MGRRGGALAGGLIGLIAGAVAIGVAHLAAGIVDPQSSPVVAVGDAAIDLSPQWLKSWAIRAFGERDKAVLLLGIGGVLVVLAVAFGIASLRRARTGLVAIAALGAIGVVAAWTRPEASVADALPAVAGAAAGGLALVLLLRTLPADDAEATGRADAPAAAIDRRRFLLAGAVGALVAAASGGLGAVLGRRFRADASRAEVLVPEPASAATTQTGADLSVAGISPFFTPNDRFYRVDTALIPPAVPAEDWRLRIHGMVDRETSLDYDDLMSRTMIERDITLACVSNPVGGPYVGNARWIGTPLRDLLEEAGVRLGADQIVSRSADGFTAGTPTAVATDGRDAMLAVAMNGEPLPIEHGFPVRMIVPGLYGYVSATKWLVELELTTFTAYDPYWIERGWAERAPIKTMSRIDTPTSSGPVAAGTVPVAGVAWAQHRGIERVELRVDDGPWVDAELGAADTLDTWRQWVVRWDATPGGHVLEVRATDGDGDVQTSDRAEPFPDGATGYHRIQVEVA